jgi:hypothetical protein
VTASETDRHPTVDSVLDVDGDPGPPETEPIPDRRERVRLDAGTRTAAWVFVAGEAAALAFYLWVGRGSWFNGDEWDFLTTRSAGSLHDLFSPHSQHWSTLPVLAYRFWWQVIGIRSYTPYLVSVVLLHLTVAALLRAVMRRSGVSAWVATAAALVFVFFGSGYFDILYGFQIGFCGSLVFGLVYLLAANHDGPFDRRDIVGLVAGLASLMCSGVGVTMVAVVVLAALIRRGWRMALAHALPLGAIYLTWFLWIGHRDYPKAATPGQTFHFAVTVVASTFAALGHGPVVGLLLAALMVTGGAMAWMDAGPARRHQELAAPLALLAGAIVFAVVTGTGRGTLPPGVSPGQVDTSRYLHIIAALSIPALAVATDSVIVRWRYAAPVVLVVLLIGVPGNIAVAVRHGNENRALAAWYRPYILSLPRLAVAKVLPPNTHPDMHFDPWMTLGWLRAGVASGRIPTPPPTVTADDRATWTLQLALQPSGQEAPNCRAYALPTSILLHRGDTVTAGRGATATLMTSPRVRSKPLPLIGYFPHATFVALDDLMLLIRRAEGTSQTITVCRTVEP